GIQLGFHVLRLNGHDHVSAFECTPQCWPVGNGFAHKQKRNFFGRPVWPRKKGDPMKSRRWKSVQPTSLQHAMELCKAYALEKHNLSEQRIAERMGEENQWTLYKWISTGRIPAVKIPAYEAACGCNFVT